MGTLDWIARLLEQQGRSAQCVTGRTRRLMRERLKDIKRTLYEETYTWNCMRKLILGKPFDCNYCGEKSK